MRSRFPTLAGLLGVLLSGTLLAEPSPPQAVGRAIAERRSRVAELQAVREAAEELGIRVWLFGGTAAGFAHYVRWDLAREAGDPRYRESFFDYDFTNIYRSTQDADLVVDGTAEQAQALEKRIREKMSFLQGSKDHWEVRLLRYPRTVGRQVKLPLLGTRDFLEQHTDSNSTGMIELTDPPRGETVVRDLRDWNNPVPFFLKDVSLGRLHYYWSPTHQRTSRYLSGDNPPLFSVIRYLVKAFQYDLAVDGEDLERVRAVIDAFDPRRDYPGMSSWAKGWLERYGPNLIRHSVNIEYAWETLEKLGLRQKLVSLSDASKAGTLAWWLSREPLRSSAVGQGNGRTARELGIDLVAHETVDFLAYESITRDTTLRPNVLISRKDFPGESAAFGPGFYTRLGRRGARGTGLTIRFQVDPQAREGSDFTVHGDFVVVHNRAALRVIPESLQATTLEFFQMLRDGVVGDSDRGSWMKLKRRISLRPLAPAEEEAIVALVEEEIQQVERPRRLTPLLQSWFDLPASREHPELVERIIEGVPCRDPGGYFRQRMHCDPGSGRHDELLHRVMWLDGWAGHPEVIRALIRRDMIEVAEDALSHPQWEGQTTLLLELIDGMEFTPGPNDNGLLNQLLKRPHWSGNPAVEERVRLHRAYWDYVAHYGTFPEQARGGGSDSRLQAALSALATLNANPIRPDCDEGPSGGLP